MCASQDPPGPAARDQYAALLPVRERVLGPEHPEILTDRVRVVGADHPDALDTRGSLAHWTEKAERDTGPDVDQ
jgi:hypothetical protein